MLATKNGPCTDEDELHSGNRPCPVMEGGGHNSTMQLDRGLIGQMHQGQSHRAHASWLGLGSLSSSIGGKLMHWVRARIAKLMLISCCSYQVHASRALIGMRGWGDGCQAEGPRH
jgi:hypothetical protein